MLEHQYSIWSGYSKEIKDRIEIILFDDCSPKDPAFEIPRPEDLPKISIYRMIEDIPWGADACKNRAADITSSEYLLMMDIDHVVPEDVLELLLKECDSYPRGTVVKFKRLENGREIVPGPNIYFIKKDLFWKIGGYDEYLLGLYCTDIPYLKRLREHTEEVILKIPIIVYGNDVIENADTTTYTRSKNDKILVEKRLKEKKELGINNIVTLSKPYEKLL